MAASSTSVPTAETTAISRNLSGQYVLDKGNSDSIQPFLKEVGAPWIARKVHSTTPTLLQNPQLPHLSESIQAADSMSMTLNIMHTEKLFEVTNSSIFRTMKNSLTIGEVRALIEPPMTQYAFALFGRI